MQIHLRSVKGITVWKKSRKHMQTVTNCSDKDKQWSRLDAPKDALRYKTAASVLFVQLDDYIISVLT